MIIFSSTSAYTQVGLNFAVHLACAIVLWKMTREPAEYFNNPLFPVPDTCYEDTWSA